jgi:hypothetical protein
MMSLRARMGLGLGWMLASALVALGAFGEPSDAGDGDAPPATSASIEPSAAASASASEDAETPAATTDSRTSTSSMRDSPNKGFRFTPTAKIVLGSVIFDLTLLGVCIDALTSKPRYPELCVPVAGPYWTLANHGPLFGQPDNFMAATVISVVEAGSLAVLVLGIVEYIQADQKPNVRVKIMPIVSPTMTGIGVVGRF